MRFIIALFLFLAIPSVCMSDTITFKNGYSIHGKVVRPGGSVFVKEGYIRVTFKNGGWFEFEEKSVSSVEENDLDQFEKAK